jgi:hypothetical protein
MPATSLPAQLAQQQTRAANAAAGIDERKPQQPPTPVPPQLESPQAKPLPTAPAYGPVERVGGVTQAAARTQRLPSANRTRSRHGPEGARRCRRTGYTARTRCEGLESSRL